MMSPPPETVRHIPGTTLVLVCQLRGNPSPVVNWLKNGVPITDVSLNSSSARVFILLFNKVHSNKYN